MPSWSSQTSRGIRPQAGKSIKKTECEVEIRDINRAWVTEANKE